MFLLNRLRRAVKKVRLLLSFDVQRWRIASMMIGGRSFDGRQQRRLSFNDRPGLAAACAAAEESGSEDSGGSSRGHHHQQLQRTVSYPSDHDQDDIDQRAEMFIANFRRQLQMERQVSLEVRYYRGNSFDWRSP